MENIPSGNVLNVVKYQHIMGAPRIWILLFLNYLINHGQLGHLIL